MTYRTRRGGRTALAVSAALAAGCLTLAPAHADASTLLIAYRTSDGIYTANQDGSDVRLVGGTYGAQDFHWSADGTHLLVEASTGLVSVGVDGSDWTRIGNGSFGGFVVDPTGDYVLAAQSGGIVAAKADGSAPASPSTVLGPSAQLTDPILDPVNGQLLGLSTQTSTLEAEAADGSETAVLPYRLSSAAVSPDGTVLAFTSGANVYVISLAYAGTGTTATVTGTTGTYTEIATAGQVGDLDWSPDGSRIYFDAGADVASVPADGGTVTVLPFKATAGPVSQAQLQPSGAPANPPPLQLPVPSTPVQPSP